MPCRTLHRHVAVVLHADAASCGTLLGLDQDDAVGGAVPVDGRRRGVFENRDGRDIRGVEQVQRAARLRWRIPADAQAGGFRLLVVDGDSVDHVQRVVARADRGATADADLGAGTGLAVVLNDRDASGPALDHLVDVRDHPDIGRVGVDGGDRPGDRLAALRAVAGHHHRLENRRLRLQHDLHRGCCAGGYRHLLQLRAVPDPNGPQTVCARGCTAQREPTVDAGLRALRRPGDRDGDTRERLLGRAVDHLAGDRASGILRAEWNRPQQATDERGNEPTEQCHVCAL